MWKKLKIVNDWITHSIPNIVKTLPPPFLPSSLPSSQEDVASLLDTGVPVRSAVPVTFRKGHIPTRSDAPVTFRAGPQSDGAILRHP